MRALASQSAGTRVPLLTRERVDVIRDRSNRRGDRDSPCRGTSQGAQGFVTVRSEDLAASPGRRPHGTLCSDAFGHAYGSRPPTVDSSRERGWRCYAAEATIELDRVALARCGRHRLGQPSGSRWRRRGCWSRVSGPIAPSVPGVMRCGGRLPP